MRKIIFQEKNQIFAESTAFVKYLELKRCGNNPSTTLFSSSCVKKTSLSKELSISNQARNIYKSFVQVVKHLPVLKSKGFKNFVFKVL